MAASKAKCASGVSDTVPNTISLWTMVYINFLFFVHVWSALMSPCSSVGPLPVVINTWPFLQSNIIGKLKCFGWKC